MEFYDAEPADIDKGLLECLNALAPTAIGAYEADFVLELRRKRGIRTVVACEQGRVIGTASLLIEPKLIHDGGNVGHIEDVAVHPGHQGKGVGQALVEHVVKLARQAECYKAILNCRPELVPFYERVGFRPHETGMRMDLCPEKATTSRSPKATTAKKSSAASSTTPA